MSRHRPGTSTKENLGDPELELIDPTPNIHALFVQFDKLYFWSSLSSVVVRWSKKMYSCAGICRYEGRSGMCDIALSEPLLKLRPRKNLIETLLHEMIHAYLFLTIGDRDRDGHGPNFCKHMYRINKAANINITIYHDFHDEVKLYQTHWWRCDGVCNRQKPYFGMVRRTSNRAPGPNDFWWSEHQKRCGGNFIKIKEPDNFKARPRNKDKNDTQNKKEIKVPAITNGKPITPTVKSKDVKPKNGTVLGSLDNYILPKLNQDANDVANVVRNHWANKNLNSQSSPSLNSVKKPDKAKKRPSLSPASNSIKTYFPTYKIPSTNSSPVSVETANKILLDIYGDDLTVIKNGEIVQPAKKLKIEQTSNGEVVQSAKKLKIEQTSNADDNFVMCPSCNQRVASSAINDHLDLCLLEDEVEEIPTVNEVVDLTNIDNGDNGNCPVCNERTNSIEEHLEVCISSFDQSISTEGASDSQYFDVDDFNESGTFNETGTKHPCPVCYEMIENDDMNAHLDECLNQRNS